MTFRTPDPNAGGWDPASWITTGTPVAGSSDPKTVEMLAKIAALVAAYGATQISTVGPAYANYLLLPDGTVTSNLALAQFDVPWMGEMYAKALASKLYLILYWGPKSSIGTTWATAEPLAVAIHDAKVAIGVAAGTPGQSIGSSVASVSAETAATQAATTTQPTAPQPPATGSGDGSTIGQPPAPNESLTYPTAGISGPLPAGQSSPTGGGPNSLAPISGTLNFGGSDTATTPGVTAAPLAGTTPLWLWLLLLIAGVVIARKATA